MIEDLPRRLVLAREALKMTQDDLSSATGLPLSTLKKYEGSHREPKAGQIALLTKAGININWLLTGVGEMLMPGHGQATNETGTPYGATQPPVDSVLLQEVIEYFYAWLDEHRGSAKIDRSRHGAVIAVMYRTAAQVGEVRKPDMEQILRLVA